MELTTTMTDPLPRQTRRNTPSDLEVMEVGDRQIVMTRCFAAPRSLVFDALITPDLLLRWMHGPEGWRMIRCEVDPTEGGPVPVRVARTQRGAHDGRGGVPRDRLSGASRHYRTVRRQSDGRGGGL